MIAFDFELTALVELSVLEANAAKLEVTGEDAAVVSVEHDLVVAHFVDDLCHSNHFIVRVFDGQTEHRSRVVARLDVNVVIESFVLQQKSCAANARLIKK